MLEVGSVKELAASLRGLAAVVGACPEDDLPDWVRFECRVGGTQMRFWLALDSEWIERRATRLLRASQKGVYTGSYRDYKAQTAPSSTARRYNPALARQFEADGELENLRSYRELHGR